jgi:hypothetical protein
MHTKMVRMIPIYFKNLADVSAFKGCPKLVGLKKFVPELRWWRAKLIALFP